MVLATLLAAIGVVTDSPVTVVGAMVVGPEFGPLAGLAVGLFRRRAGIARRAVIALLVGFPVAIVITGVLAVIARAAGLISPSDITGAGRQTEFIYSPGWFSLITALVAGTAGMLSLTSSKSAALVGVFISVTTIPAAGNAAVAGVLGKWGETWRSMAQLGINVVGIAVAGVITLAVLRAASGIGSDRRHRNRGSTRHLTPDSSAHGLSRYRRGTSRRPRWARNSASSSSSSRGRLPVTASRTAPWIRV